MYSLFCEYIGVNPTTPTPSHHALDPTGEVGVGPYGMGGGGDTGGVNREEDAVLFVYQPSVNRGGGRRLPKPLSDQLLVRVCSFPLCIINRL